MIERHCSKEPMKKVLDYERLEDMIRDWGTENRFDSDDYSDVGKLVDLKREKQQKITLAIPTLNEENTLGNVINTIKSELKDKYPLLDEIIVIDSDSTDNTKDVAHEAGADGFFLASAEKLEGKIHYGKGENLWTSLYVSNGDIISWIDADIKNIHPRFVYGQLGPLLENDNLGYIKGHYDRPPELVFDDERKAHYKVGGGRVTELVARPLVNLFYPMLMGFMQPLSGEYGGRRQVLENVPFYTGYSVEMGLLIELVNNYGLETMGTVDLKERVHNSQDNYSLSKMAFGIISAVLDKAQQDDKLSIKFETDHVYRRPELSLGEFNLSKDDVMQVERPPMVTLKTYQDKFGINDSENDNHYE